MKHHRLKDIVFQSTLPTRGSDLFVTACDMIYRVSIHAPHEGERRWIEEDGIQICSVSIHAPHEGERQYRTIRTSKQIIVSIHAPHEGERLVLHVIAHFKRMRFNPRSPRGGATAEKCICMQHFREFTEYYPLRHGDACCIAPQDCIIQAFFGAKKRCFYVRLCFALKNKGVRG